MPSVIFTAEEYLAYQKRKIIRIEDYKAVKDACTECGEVGALLSKSTNVVGNGHSSNNTSTSAATSWTMLSLNNINIRKLLAAASLLPMMTTPPRTSLSGTTSSTTLPRRRRPHRQRDSKKSTASRTRSSA